MKFAYPVLLAASFLLAGEALAVSYNCQKATGEDEKAICTSIELSKLDDDLAAAYKATMQLLSGDKRRSAMLRKDQVEWIQNRSRCGATVSCLKNEYTRRIRWVKNPAHQYSGTWVSKTAKLTMHVRDDGYMYVALYPDRKKPNDQQDMVFMTNDGKFVPANENKQGEDLIMLERPQFSRANQGLKATCGTGMYLSFGTATMMGFEAGPKCDLLKAAGQNDFKPSGAPLFVYDPMR